MIVNDEGFTADDWTGGWSETGAGGAGIELGADGSALDVDLGAPAIRIRFASFADGRGFTLARQLRGRGYTGRLRAFGPIIADQYAMARRSGFDEVEIPDDLAARQTEPQWLARANWRAHDYQARLGATS